MFTHTCTACARTQLIFDSLVTGVAGTPDGVVLTFECWCGAEQTALMPGTAPERDVATAS